MKKYFPILVMMLVLAFIIQFVENKFISNREVTYYIADGDKKYEINEKFNYIDSSDYYDFSIKYGDEQYNYSFNHDFNRQKEVIKSIERFEYDDLSCIFPIYRNNVLGNITCLVGGQQASYTFLKQINQKNIDRVVGEIKNLGYTNKIWGEKSDEVEELSTESRSIKVYKNNLLDDYTFLIWNYKGLYLLNKDDLSAKTYFENDHYDNRFSRVVGNYYVTFDIRSSDDISFSQIFYYNLKKRGHGIIYLNDFTSKNYYINGIIDGQLYYTDAYRRKQFVVSIKNEKSEIVGDADSNIQFINYVDGKKEKMAPNEFLKEQRIFDAPVKNESINSKFGDVVIYKDRDFYYFASKTGQMYKCFDENADHCSILFGFDSISDWKIKNGDILAVSGDKVYFYNEQTELVPIAINSELVYNYNNICDFWKKN